MPLNNLDVLLLNDSEPPPEVPAQAIPGGGRITDTLIK